MTTGATGQLGLALPVQGELSGTWGDTVNNGITQYTNIAIAGTLTLTGDGAVTLANTTGDASASNITSTLTGAGTVTAQFAIVRVTGTLTVAKVVTGPSYSKTYTVVNAATGGIVTFKAAGQTGVSVAVGESAFVYFNGTDYVKLAGTVAVASFQTSLSGLTPSTATTGAVTLAGTLGVASGGTGLTAGTSGGILGYTATGTLASSVALTANALVLGAGAGATPTPMASLGTTTTVLHGNASGAPTFGAVSLTADVTGTLPTANGGTNLTSFTSGGVVYASSTSALATGSALTFDGTTLTGTASGAIAATFNRTTSSGATVKVQVVGNDVGTLGSSTDGQGCFDIAASQSIYLRATGASQFIRFDANNTEGMRLTSTGLGIGTSSPAVKLDVVGAIRAVTASTAANSVRIGNTGNSLFLGVDSSTGGTNIVGSVAYATTLATNTAIQLSTNNGASVQATFNQSGNLGIGTSSPDCRLMLETPSGTACQINLSQSAVTNYRLSIPASTDALTFVYGASTERMRLDSAGNLGLGVTPSAWQSGFKAFDVGTGSSLANPNSNGQTWLATNAYYNSVWKYKNNGTSTLYESDSAHKWYIAASGTAGANISFTQAMTLSADGDLAIGTTTALARVYGKQSTANQNGVMMQASANDMEVRLFHNGTVAGIASSYRSTASYSPLTFWTSDTERARIDADGYFYLRTTTRRSSAVFSLDSTTGTTNGMGLFASGTASSGMIVFSNPNGNVGSIDINGSATTYSTSSDYRLKNTIAPMTGALAKVAQLKPVTYKWNVDGSDCEGFIAHELAEVVPQCVTGEKDAVDADGNPKYQGIDTSFLVATLTAAIQEQQAIIESLKARLDAANL